MKSQTSAEQRFSWPEIFSGAVSKIGGRVEWIDEFSRAGLLTLASGYRIFFHKGVLGVNNVASARIARDKGFTTEYLRSRGHSVPEEKAFFRNTYSKSMNIDRGIDAAIAYAAKIGFPVYVKPAHLSQGRGVAKVYSVRQLEVAIERVLSDDTVCIIQRAYEGSDVRLIVVYGDVLVGYERVPLTVIGDGVSTIGELLVKRQQHFVRAGRDTVIDALDWRLVAILDRRNLTLNDIVSDGVSVPIHDVANLSLGGVAVDKSETLKLALGDVARRVCADLQLAFCGVDLIVDLDSPDPSHVILEVNSAPGLDNYLYGDTAPLDYIQELYASLLLALSTGGSGRCKVDLPLA